jgi:ABC-type transport system involved in cytochrome c biogenesis permease component
MPFLTIAAKDLRLLLRDPRSAVILLVMPLVLILVLGLALGEAFGRKPDDQLQLTVVDLDRGLSTSFDPVPPLTDEPSAAVLGGVSRAVPRRPYPSMWDPPPRKGPAGALAGGATAVLPVRRNYPPTGKWSDVVLADLKNTGNIRIERVGSREEAEQLVRRGKRSAVVVFNPEFSDRLDRCSFVGGEFKIAPINPMDRFGVRTSEVGVTVIENPTQPVGAAVTKQITQVSLMRVVIPWMIGQAFDLIGSPLFMDRMEKYIPQLKLAYSIVNRETIGAGIKRGIQAFFENYDFTAPTWHGLTKDSPTAAKDVNDTRFEEPPAFGRGTKRYQVLVPSYAVTFAFFLVLTSGWLFAAERRHGTLVRLEAAPIGLEQLLLGKLIPCLVVSVLQGAVLLVCGKVVFGMSWGLQPLLLLPVVLSTSLAAVGMAVLVGVAAKTEAQVSVYGTLLVLVLAGLSGSMMPREMMPESMRQWSKVTPHAWALEAYEHLLYPDATTIDAGVVWADCGVLTLFGAGFLAIAWAWAAVGRRWSS